MKRKSPTTNRLSFTTIGLAYLVWVGLGISYADIDPKSIVGAWLFNETKGKLEGGAKWGKGKFGNAVQLNGKDAWVSVPEIELLEEFTILKWFNSTGRVGMWRCFFNRDGWSSGFVHYQFRPDNKMEMAIHSNNPVRHPGWQTSPFTADKKIQDQWHHLAVAYSSKKGTVQVYFDGKLDAEGKWGPHPGAFGPGRIGSWSGGGREWEGLFDEMIIFNTPLAKADIQRLMNKGLEAELGVDSMAKLSTIWAQIKH